MANEIKKYIIEEIARPKYLSTSVDSAPNITHVDQLGVTVRYLLNGFSHLVKSIVIKRLIYAEPIRLFRKGENRHYGLAWSKLWTMQIIWLENIRE